ncbi:hypothetical protein BKA62DRAFT_715812 [Auriculariales sp. MPI-PUGE-AT-0066]|nr:hypothetical protein BKA62DRAFT_715812 [Auriculariales sp. MPI-PUGE-AT-0066]
MPTMTRDQLISLRSSSIRFPRDTMSQDNGPSHISALGEPMVFGPRTPHAQQLEQMAAALALVPDVIVPASRENSPTTEARLERNARKMKKEILAGSLVDNYPRLLCTRVRGPFEELGTLWGKTLPDEERQQYGFGREWSPFPDTEEEALARERERRAERRELGLSMNTHPSDLVTQTWTNGSGVFEDVLQQPGQDDEKETPKTGRHPQHRLSEGNWDDTSNIVPDSEPPSAQPSTRRRVSFSLTKWDSQAMPPPPPLLHAVASASGRFNGESGSASKLIPRPESSPIQRPASSPRSSTRTTTRPLTRSMKGKQSPTKINTASPRSVQLARMRAAATSRMLSVHSDSSLDDDELVPESPQPQQTALLLGCHEERQQGPHASLPALVLSEKARGKQRAIDPQPSTEDLMSNLAIGTPMKRKVALLGPPAELEDDQDISNFKIRKKAKTAPSDTISVNPKSKPKPKQRVYSSKKAQGKTRIQGAATSGGSGVSSGSDAEKKTLDPNGKVYSLTPQTKLYSPPTRLGDKHAFGVSPMPKPLLASSPAIKVTSSSPRQPLSHNFAKLNANKGQQQPAYVAGPSSKAAAMAIVDKLSSSPGLAMSHIPPAQAAAFDIVGPFAFSAFQPQAESTQVDEVCFYYPQHPPPKSPIFASLLSPRTPPKSLSPRSLPKSPIVEIAASPRPSAKLTPQKAYIEPRLSPSRKVGILSLFAAPGGENNQVGKHSPKSKGRAVVATSPKLFASPPARRPGTSSPARIPVSTLLSSPSPRQVLPAVAALSPPQPSSSPPKEPVKLRAKYVKMAKKDLPKDGQNGDDDLKDDSDRYEYAPSHTSVHDSPTSSPMPTAPSGTNGHRAPALDEDVVMQDVVPTSMERTAPGSPLRQSPQPHVPVTPQRPRTGHSGPSGEPLTPVSVQPKSSAVRTAIHQKQRLTESLDLSAVSEEVLPKRKELSSKPARISPIPIHVPQQITASVPAPTPTPSRLDYSHIPHFSELVQQSAAKKKAAKRVKRLARAREQELKLRRKLGVSGDHLEETTFAAVPDSSPEKPATERGSSPDGESPLAQRGTRRLIDRATSPSPTRSRDQTPTSKTPQFEQDRAPSSFQFLAECSPVREQATQTPDTTIVLPFQRELRQTTSVNTTTTQLTRAPTDQSLLSDSNSQGFAYGQQDQDDLLYEQFGFGGMAEASQTSGGHGYGFGQPTPGGSRSAVTQDNQDKGNISQGNSQDSQDSLFRASELAPSQSPRMMGNSTLLFKTASSHPDGPLLSSAAGVPAFDNSADPWASSQTDIPIGTRREHDLNRVAEFLEGDVWKF